MRRSIAKSFFAAVILTMVLFGCGGGSSTGTVTSVVTAKTVAGVAATGAPIAGTIYLKDSSTPSVQRSTPIAADGTYSFDVTSLTAPYMLKAVGTANGQNYTLYSMAGAPGVANVNPLTHLAVTRAYGGADPATLFASMTPAQIQELQVAIATATSQIQTILQPILAQYNIPTNIDFMATTYTANHAGLDLLFDLIDFAANNGTMTVTNKKSGTPIITTSLSGNTLSGTVAISNIPAMPTSAVYANTLTPAVTAGGSATFYAFIPGSMNSTVNWRVIETGGGSITTAGVYTAPATPGTYHVLATSTVDTSVSSTVTITVSPSQPAATLTSITVYPATSGLAVGGTHYFTATGIYSDSSTKDITSSVTWSSSNQSTATVNAVGLVTATDVGSSSITATMGKTSGSSTISVQSVVPTPTLASIAVTPASPGIVVGATQQFIATGTYSDSSTIDLTGSATWSSSSTSVATITTSGNATAVSSGTATITATSGTIAASTTLSVTSKGTITVYW